MVDYLYKEGVSSVNTWVFLGGAVTVITVIAISMILNMRIYQRNLQKEGKR